MSPGITNLDFLPRRMGVAMNRNSGYEKFEAVNPADWVARGYAVVNMNARGAYDSQGDIRLVSLPHFLFASAPWLTRITGFGEQQKAKMAMMPSSTLLHFHGVTARSVSQGIHGSQLRNGSLLHSGLLIWLLLRRSKGFMTFIVMPLRVEVFR